MPSFVAASMTVAPGATWTDWPSISSVIGLASAGLSVGMSVGGELVGHGGRIDPAAGGRAVAAGIHRAALVVDVVLELVAVDLHERAHGHRRGVAQRADRSPLDVVGEVEQQVEVLLPALARLDAVDDAIEPAGALPARRALPAGLLEVEVRQALGGLHHARVLVHDDDRARAQERARLGDR